MALTIDEVDHIARLARIDLNPEQKALYREQLEHPGLHRQAA
jgi:Asp-tRNA(Asn)/Glu-tRNA(Gln) amidotransferase C subunit